MKKIIISLLIALFIIPGISFYNARGTANNVVLSQKENITPLSGGVLLFFDDKFTPCWHFKGEYSDKMTGSTFDVFVSFTGNIVELNKRQPPIK